MTKLETFLAAWPVQHIGPKPTAEHVGFVAAKGFEGLDALKCLMLLRPNGASHAELDYAVTQWRGAQMRPQIHR